MAEKEGRRRLSIEDEELLQTPSRWSPTGWYCVSRRLLNPNSPTKLFFKPDHPQAKHRSISHATPQLSTESRDQYRSKLPAARRAMDVKLPPMRSVSRSQDFDVGALKYYEVTLGGMFGTPTCVRKQHFILHQGTPLPVSHRCFGRKRDGLSAWGDTLVTKGLVTKGFAV